MILHIDQREFLINCVDVVEQYGTNREMCILGQERNSLVYEDNVILIAKSSDNKWMEIVRKYNNNSFYYMSDGETIRFHGDFVFLEDHVNKLLGKL